MNLSYINQPPIGPYSGAIPYVSGKIYSNMRMMGETFATATIANDVLVCIPYVVEGSSGASFVEINAVSSTVAVGATARIGIYANKPGNFAYPKALLVDAGLVAMDLTGAHPLVIDFSYSGLIWLAIVHNFVPSIDFVAYGGAAGAQVPDHLGRSAAGILTNIDSHISGAWVLGATGFENTLPTDYETTVAGTYQQGPAPNLTLTAA